MNMLLESVVLSSAMVTNWWINIPPGTPPPQTEVREYQSKVISNTQRLVDSVLPPGISYKRFDWPTQKTHFIGTQWYRPTEKMSLSFWVFKTQSWENISPWQTWVILNIDIK